ncbi:MAG: Uma2 family endonuclease [Limnothrix sp.]
MLPSFKKLLLPFLSCGVVLAIARLCQILLYLPWSKVPFNAAGELENEAIADPPDWTIEILSPGQRSTKVIDNILYCLDFGCHLGWLLDPEDHAVLVFQPNQSLRIFRGDDAPNIPSKIPLQLTVNQIFS